MTAQIPQLATLGLDTTNHAPPTPHKMSGRRLSKSVMRSDSGDVEGSKSWGMAQLEDGSGTSRAVRVVQKAEAEDFNMFKVTWVWTLDNKVNQVDLRHGRKSGIRKIYFNKELVERQKSLKKMMADSGSVHQFDVTVPGGPTHTAEIEISSKGGLSGFHYQLSIDGNPVEQNLAGPMTKGPLDIGDRQIALLKSAAGLGMTLRNNPLGPTGVVVWTVEPGKAAEAAGMRVGDVVLSVENEIVDDIGPLTEIVAKVAGTHVHMELAGTTDSREVLLTKNMQNKQPIGLGMQTTSCGVGILVTEIDKGSSSEQSDLKLGDCILSIDGCVPSSPKDAVSMILKAGTLDGVVRFVVIGDDHPEAALGKGVSA